MITETKKTAMTAFANNANDLVFNDRDAIKSLFAMIAAANREQEFTEIQSDLFAEALLMFKISKKEAQQAFWKAYADPYKPQGKIEFCHLWKYISEERTKTTPDSKLYTYNEALAYMVKHGLEQNHNRWFTMVPQTGALPLWQLKPEVRL
jgi:hypothetical protein